MNSNWFNFKTIKSKNYYLSVKLLMTKQIGELRIIVEIHQTSNCLSILMNGFTDYYSLYISIKIINDDKLAEN